MGDERCNHKYGMLMPFKALHVYCQENLHFRKRFNLQFVQIVVEIWLKGIRLRTDFIKHFQTA